MDLSAFMDRHDKVVLQFSAGKDSAACLKLVRPWLNKILVIWANPGDPYKETVEYMAKIKASVPNFLELLGQQPHFVRSVGYPADSVPFNGTDVGVTASGRGTRVVHVDKCCGVNMWGPMYRAVKASGATGVIRGQKRSDSLKAPIDSLSIHDGIEYCFPLFDWGDAEVTFYVGKDDLPASYKRGLKSSLDCRTCTAYAAHNPGRLKDLAIVEPDAYAQIEPVIAWLRDEAEINMNNLHGMCHV